MSFPYNPNLPNPPDNPSVDVAGMQTNAGTINSWTQVDHIGFNNTDAGQHLQLNFPGVTTQLTPSGLGSVAYTSAGTANTGAAEFFMKNSSASLILSAVKAFGVVNGSGSLLNGFNVSSITNPNAGRYTITLPSGVLTGSNYSVIGSASNGNNFVLLNYTITNSVSFSIVITNASSMGTPPISFSFVVLQL